VSIDTSHDASSQRRVAGRVTASSQDESGKGFQPLTPEEARRWRSQHPQLPVTRALMWQMLVGGVVAVLAWLFTQRAIVGWSAAYGALAGVLPAAVAAWGATRWARPGFPAGVALAGLLLWEGVKLVLTVGMLWVAPRFLGVPSWPALLVGLVLTIKMYWIGLLWARPVKSGQMRREHTDGC